MEGGPSSVIIKDGSQHDGLWNGVVQIRDRDAEPAGAKIAKITPTSTRANRFEFELTDQWHSTVATFFRRECPRPARACPFESDDSG